MDSLRKQPLNGSFKWLVDPHAFPIKHRGNSGSRNPQGALLELAPAVPRERKSYKPWSVSVHLDEMIDTPLLELRSVKDERLCCSLKIEKSFQRMNSLWIGRLTIHSLETRG